MPVLSCRPLYTVVRSRFLMGGSKHLPVRCSAAAAVPLSSHRLLRLHSGRRLLFQSARRPTSIYQPSSLKSARFFSVGPVMPNKAVHLRKLDDQMTDRERLAQLKSTLEGEGIKCVSFQPGQYSHMTCPQETWKATTCGEYNLSQLCCLSWVYSHVSLSMCHDSVLMPSPCFSN